MVRFFDFFAIRAMCQSGPFVRYVSVDEAASFVYFIPILVDEAGSFVYAWLRRRRGGLPASAIANSLQLLNRGPTMRASCAMHPIPINFSLT